MEIILLLIALVGWIVNLNGWFIVPMGLVYGLGIAGVVVLVIKLIIYFVAKHEINKHFDNFDRW